MRKRIVCMLLSGMLCLGMGVTVMAEGGGAEIAAESTGEAAGTALGDKDYYAIGMDFILVWNNRDFITMKEIPASFDHLTEAQSEIMKPLLDKLEDARAQGITEVQAIHEEFLKQNLGADVTVTLRHAFTKIDTETAGAVLPESGLILQFKGDPTRECLDDYTRILVLELDKDGNFTRLPATDIDGFGSIKAENFKSKDSVIFYYTLKDPLPISQVSQDGLVQEDGKFYFYENGEMAASKEAYVNGAWRWFDADGTMAVSKDVYQRSSGGKWVRYNEKGEMVKGWDTNGDVTYYFDPVTGAMEKGVTGIDGKYYYFLKDTGIRVEDKDHETFRDGAWMWFDADGTVAVSKDVYQRSSGGKWVRYNAEAAMIKGWDTNENGTYYFDPITGAMTKGSVTIDGKNYSFDETTGIMIQ